MSREIDYTFWLNATLAAIPIVLAVLAVVLTVAGVIGYRRIRGEAVRMARQEAKKAVDKLVESGGLRSMVDESVKREGDQVYVDLRFTKEKVAGLVAGPIKFDFGGKGSGFPQGEKEGGQS